MNQICNGIQFYLDYAADNPMPSGMSVRLKLERGELKAAVEFPVINGNSHGQISLTNCGEFSQEVHAESKTEETVDIVTEHDSYKTGKEQKLQESNDTAEIIHRKESHHKLRNRAKAWTTLQMVVEEQNLTQALQCVRTKAAKLSKHNRKVCRKFCEECDLTSIAREILNKEYRPTPSIKVEIPKRNGGIREIMMQQPKDKVICTAIKQVIEPYCEDRIFRKCSYAYRPGIEIAQLIQEVKLARTKNWNYAVKADLEDFFGSIDRNRLMQDLQRLHMDPELTYLMKTVIQETAYRDKGGKIVNIKQGVPQGNVLSPILANLYGTELDEMMTEKGVEYYYRYADDILILARDKEDMQEKQNTLLQCIREVGLKMNVSKLSLQPVTGIEFLGVVFTADGLSIPKKRLIDRVNKMKEEYENGVSMIESSRNLIHWLRVYKRIDDQILLSNELQTRFRNELIANSLPADYEKIWKSIAEDDAASAAIVSSVGEWMEG